MRKKLISTLLLATLLCAALAEGVTKPVEVNAATKTATLVDTKVSFDGNEPVIVQSYSIDGYNYIRVAEIAKHIGMGVMPAYHEVGVLIQPTTPYSSGKLEKITEKSISIELTTGTVFYGGLRYENAQCFNYANRYYYKLADLIAASQYSLGRNITFAKDEANSAYYKEPTKKTFPSFEIEWDSSTSTVKVSKKVTDLQKIFNEARASKGIRFNDAPPETVASTVKPVSEVAPAFIPQPELTNAPEVGAVLANILIDKNKGSYNIDGSINIDNITEYYRDKDTSFFGQCTWYATGRFEETTGINIMKAPNKITGKGLDNWVNGAMSGNCPNLSGTTDLSKIVSRSIAVWASHVVFVEYVERDASGMPVNVYYTEANSGHDGITLKRGVYYLDFDSKVKVKSYSDFTSYKSGGNPLLGYIVAK